MLHTAGTRPLAAALPSPPPSPLHPGARPPRSPGRCPPSRAAGAAVPGRPRDPGGSGSPGGRRPHVPPAPGRAGVRGRGSPGGSGALCPSAHSRTGSLVSGALLTCFPNTSSWNCSSCTTRLDSDLLVGGSAWMYCGRGLSRGPAPCGAGPRGRAGPGVPYLLVVLAEPKAHVVELADGVRGLVVLDVGAAVLLPHRHLPAGRAAPRRAAPQRPLAAERGQA